MEKKRFSVGQMIGVLKQAEVGVPIADVIRKAEISEQKFYRWKAKYADLEAANSKCPCRRLPIRG
jgi:putative transposase